MSEYRIYKIRRPDGKWLYGGKFSHKWSENANVGRDWPSDEKARQRATEVREWYSSRASTDGDGLEVIPFTVTQGTKLTDEQLANLVQGELDAESARFREYQLKGGSVESYDGPTPKEILLTILKDQR